MTARNLEGPGGGHRPSRTRWAFGAGGVVSSGSFRADQRSGAHRGQPPATRQDRRAAWLQTHAHSAPRSGRGACVRLRPRCRQPAPRIFDPQGWGGSLRSGSLRNMLLRPASLHVRLAIRETPSWARGDDTSSGCNRSRIDHRRRWAFTRSVASALFQPPGATSNLPPHISWTPIPSARCGRGNMSRPYLH